MTEKCKINFDPQLLDHIRLGKNKKARSLLDESLIKAYDDYGTLLHHAARFKNAAMVRHLIKLGCDVDQLGHNDKTAIMLAVQNCHVETVQILLEARSNIDVVDGNITSAIQMVFNPKYESNEILRMFLNKLQTEDHSTEELITKLKFVGCNLHHAARLQDLKLMESMLKHGVDVNSRGSQNRTALFEAADSEDLSLTEWLIEKGADVNALDDEGKSALYVAAWHGNKTLVQLLLEHGADPNVTTYMTETLPLFITTCRAAINSDKVECVELLLQYDAVPTSPLVSLNTIFDSALATKSPNLAEYLVAQLAMLVKKGMAIDKSVMCQNYKDFVLLTGHYELCEKALKIDVFQKLSLCELLTGSDSKMRTYVRNEGFIPKIECMTSMSNLGELFPYYCNRLKKRVNKAVDMVKLEDIAIPIVCAFLGGNVNECYIAARIVISYLSKRDLEGLTKV